MVENVRNSGQFRAPLSTFNLKFEYRLHEYTLVSFEMEINRIIEWLAFRNFYSIIFCCSMNWQSTVHLILITFDVNENVKLEKDKKIQWWCIKSIKTWLINTFDWIGTWQLLCSNFLLYVYVLHWIAFVVWTRINPERNIFAANSLIFEYSI